MTPKRSEDPEALTALSTRSLPDDESKRVAIYSVDSLTITSPAKTDPTALFLHLPGFLYCHLLGSMYHFTLEVL